MQAEAETSAIRERLQETSAALVDANQELAQLPLVKHRLAEMYAQNDVLKRQADEVLRSRSWRVTAFLRNVRRTLKVQR